jgi:glutamine synthetase
MTAGPEAEFFLFQTRNGRPTTESHDAASYFDLSPVDQGEDVRREIVLALESMGLLVDAAHHEVAPGQHEIDLRYDDVLTAADNISTLRFTVKHVAIRNGLHATFMPKPVYGVNGSGLHTHMSLFSKGENVFFDAAAPMQLSRTCLSYIGGVLRHAKGFCAITNPLVNSYKRLVPGFEAPTSVAWSEKNRSPLVRVPAARGKATRIELRMPDPACNPYLALAVMLRAGLDGIEKQVDPGPPINKNIFTMSHRERRHLRIDDLPGNLSEANSRRTTWSGRRSATTSSSTSSPPSATSGTTTSATSPPGKPSGTSASTDRRLLTPRLGESGQVGIWPFGQVPS